MRTNTFLTRSLRDCFTVEGCNGGFCCQGRNKEPERFLTIAESGVICAVATVLATLCFFFPLIATICAGIAAVVIFIVAGDDGAETGFLKKPLALCVAMIVGLIFWQLETLSILGCFLALFALAHLGYIVFRMFRRKPLSKQ